jgi:hypothetical protein
MKGFVHLIALCGMFFCMQTQAQDQQGTRKPPIDSIARRNSPKMLFEFVAGPSVSTTWRDKYYYDTQVPYWRYSIGLGFNHSLSRRFELGTKLLWEGKGNRWENFPDPDGSSSRFSIQGYKFNYITMALSVHYFLDRKHRSYGGLGLSGGLLVHDENYFYAYDQPNGTLVDYTESMIDDIYVRFEAGLIATAGYRFVLPGNLFLNLQVIGNLGFTDIEEDFAPINTYPMSNANISLLIGIGIPHHESGG